MRRKARFFSHNSGMQAIAILVFLGVAAQPFAAMARFVPKEGMGRAGRRIGLATRTPACSVMPDSKALTVLVPQDNNGLTSQPFPTFSWFMPRHSFHEIEFRLSVETEEQQLQTVYTTLLDNQGQNQYLSFTLPESGEVAPLAEGKNYNWKIILVCDPEDPSGNMFAEGWVQYQAAPSHLTRQLATAPPEAQADLFLSYGYWYDGVQRLLPGANSPSKRQTQWQELMTHEAVKLDHLLSTPQSSMKNCESRL
ncbi:DUF928 domain-containing protein [Lyngbya confervoides]|uniref:DUF928 domain-containing protein n=1 Tax=Lyngbya confervoides BDU141951 TaxID=1574623 RepID=A0ABD4T860_9CYAN|nr:DUF928 domain-containing protein [Lyngbya confervoides]MCM1984704.1 DUF928 domain-containing protein [Lyngbya confervoides BDU141951]